MKRFPFALRFSVPAILLLLGSSLSLFSFQREVSLSYQHAEEDAIRQARSLGDENSAMLEYLFLYRQADRSAADLLISKTGGNPNLRLVLMCDENNLVILSNRYELQHRPVSSTEVAYRLSSFERVRQTLTGQVILALDKRSVQAIYPVALGTTSGQLRPTKVGVLLLRVRPFYIKTAILQRCFTAFARSQCCISTTLHHGLVLFLQNLNPASWSTS